jgi:hypothetical protein
MLAHSFRSPSGSLTLAALALAVLAFPALAAWPNDPTVNVPVSTAAGYQIEPSAVSDGAGGMIVVWGDSRTGTYDVYAQRISASGAALWTANGVPVCTATGDQDNPVLVGDGSGGVLITWGDDRSGDSDIYAQRLNSNGVAQWTANGVALCTAAGEQSHPKITTDGAGGAIAAWEDTRSGNPDVYARRVNSSGTPQWTTNGVVICNAADTQGQIVIAPDNAGGAMLAWTDSRNGTDPNIYTQRVNSAGTVVGTANGVTICNASGTQTNLRGIPDGNGGLILAWSDFRSGAEYDLYAQRVVTSLFTAWSTNGKVICGATGNQNSPSLCSDGSGGAIIAWGDGRGADYNIYAQRVTASGVANWTADGVGMCTATGTQISPICEADGLGGALIGWEDSRSAFYSDIYAQRVSSTGSTLWASSGVPVLVAEFPQTNVVPISDGAGGGIFVAQDNRFATTYDLYCQHVERYGQLGEPEPSITSIKDVRNDQGGFVKVSWSASYLDADPTFGIYDYRLWRSVPSALAARQALTRGVTADSDAAALEGSLLVSAAAPGYAWELAGSQTADALPDYSLVTATLSDSIPGSFPSTVFMIEARASSAISADRWYSAPDSGYSVDNLAPAAPAPLTGQYAAGQTRLHWNPNTEVDLAGYRLYRGTSAAFVPSPATFVADLPDTGYADAAGAPYVYKLRAVDSHGNESPVATLIPSGTLGVDDFAAPRAFLALASANPSRGAQTTLRFGLATAGHASLALYDASGRRVRTLAGGTLEAGEHSAQWDGRDDGGRKVAAGLYFARLEARGMSRTLRIVRAK